MVMKAALNDGLYVFFIYAGHTRGHSANLEGFFQLILLHPQAKNAKSREPKSGPIIFGCSNAGACRSQYNIKAAVCHFRDL